MHNISGYSGRWRHSDQAFGGPTTFRTIYPDPGHRDHGFSEAGLSEAGFRDEGGAGRLPRIQDFQSVTGGQHSTEPHRSLPWTLRHPGTLRPVDAPLYSNLFGGLDDGFLSRAEALAAASDISKCSSPSPLHMKQDTQYGGGGGHCGSLAGGGPPHGGHQHHHQQQQQHPGAPSRSSHPMSAHPHHGFGSPSESMLDQLSAGGGGGMPAGGMPPGLACREDQMGAPPPSSLHGSHMYSTVYTNLGCTPGGPGGGSLPGMLGHVHHHHQHHALPPGLGGPGGAMLGHHAAGGPGAAAGSGVVSSTQLHCAPSELDCDPRELEAFAEHFKQRRIKLGATQADVGSALGKLKLPGVGSLSQSTICRFESLTLSHNNMLALKPVLSAWLAEAERAARESRLRDELMHGLADKKRKRTSIAAPEKRSLEAYFVIQPRPSGEKIAQIADKLDLKKNVVRVWFCNQRQKQKRMKFSANTMQGGH